jgi:capsular exopolysaccharide synthesis family protein
MVNRDGGLQTTDTRYQDYIDLLFRRKGVIVTAFLVVLAVTLYFALTKPDVYESGAQILIETPTFSSFFNLDVEAQQRSHSIDFYKTILESNSFLDAVAESTFREELHSETSPMTLSDARARVWGRVDFQPMRYEGLYYLSARAETRDLSFELATAALAVFQEQADELIRRDSAKLKDFIDEHVEVVGERLDQHRKDMSDFMASVGLSPGEDKEVTAELNRLQTQLAGAIAERENLQADVVALQGQWNELDRQLKGAATGSASGRLTQLRAQLDRLEAEREQLLLTMSESDQQVVDLDDRIAEARDDYWSATVTAGGATVDLGVAERWQNLGNTLAQKREALRTASGKVQYYKNALGNYKNQHPQILEHAAELAKHQRLVELDNRAIAFLVEEREKAQIKKATETAGMKVIDPPRLPAAPLPKRTKILVVMGALVGLLLGVGAAYALEYFDNSIRKPDDITKTLGLTVLGSIPQIRVSDNSRPSVASSMFKGGSDDAGDTTGISAKVITHLAPKDPISEAYRTLRTNLQFARLDHPLRSLLISSSGPKEGKSLTVVNLATAFAQMGEKTIVVDADMRRPVQHNLTGLEREPGLSDVLTGTLPLDRAIQETEVENLYLLPGGPSVANPAELLASSKMSDVVDHLSEQFAMVILDTPPVVAVTDAAVLSSKVSGTVLVCRWGVTDRSLAMHAADLLRKVNARVVGVVLNNIDVYHRYGSYGHYYHYYYASEREGE